MKLTEKQKLATEHFKGPGLVLAVPGAGKTTMILYRILKLIDRGVDPKRILTITFSKAATINMAKRFSSLYNKKGTNFFTIHAFCYRILLDYARLRGKNYNLIEDSKGSKMKILRQIYLSVNKIYPTDEILDLAFNEISACKNLLLNPSTYENNKFCQTLNFEKIYRSYESYKESKHLIDFDDMLTLTYKLLKEDNYFREKYRAYFDFIQVDEGQDTSYVQFLILKLLTKPKNNIFIVADDDQCIYGFRGASPDELLNLKTYYKDLKIYYMNENFRSSKNIVNISNIFIGQNENRFKKTIITNNSWNTPVSLIKVKDAKDQYDFILKKLHNLTGTSAILYRNNLSAVGLVEYLERNNIDFNIKDTRNKFFTHFIIKDILDIMNFSKDLSNISLYEKFYYKLEGYISKSHIAYIKTKPTSNIFKVLMNYPGLSDYYLKNISKLAGDFKSLKAKNMYGGIDFIENQMGYFNYLEENAKRLGESINALAEYIFYIKLIAGNTQTMEEFTGRLKHLEFLLRRPKDSKANLSLSTIHSAKGLEYDNVFLIDLIEGNIPSSVAIDQLTESKDFLEEERRLFYVAMTRAKDNLFLLYPSSRNKVKNEMSRFLTDLTNYNA